MIGRRGHRVRYRCACEDTSTGTPGHDRDKVLRRALLLCQVMETLHRGSGDVLRVWPGKLVCREIGSPYLNHHAPPQAAGKRLTVLADPYLRSARCICVWRHSREEVHDDEPPSPFGYRDRFEYWGDLGVGSIIYSRHQLLEVKALRLQKAVFSDSGVLSFRRERVCGDSGSGYHARLPSGRPRARLLLVVAPAAPV